MLKGKFVRSKTIKFYVQTLFNRVVFGVELLVVESVFESAQFYSRRSSNVQKLLEECHVNARAASPITDCPRSA